MARRQTVYVEGRQVHVGPAAREGEREAAAQSAQGVVPQPRRGRAERRLRGDVQAGATATRVHRAARLRLHSSLSMPRVTEPDAAEADRYGTLQVRRVQAERIHQGNAQSGLLEIGPALSRRSR